ncbi:2-amino-4-hydroxy-6-hydroxymethyldihydropteridine diphosphokinase [Engelhardtia mirabilis]|uniref:2-amino-4-hydroxy-6-hydroxymethyldihydropteridine pyrophosphokinase n=1 Tax=Engelhardtia mirabilis TaxID=2528011 RepID=A0A518BML0_9BACT|nr:2-amino-4-hydroxy-6-hydroxymethyldihydropteridine pyrophosphokinase [Planctomycetes bacterium Pla133]QDV02548.1 2-amino-4-hydroxy-6-hydroxymethyldihydropteridine pyrophosphokinase [Planctomycetes bacterium Pla86]
MSEVAWLGLGANIGDPEAQISGALESLAADPRLELLRVSTLIETDPVGGPPGQPRFLNGVAEVRWAGEPEALLELLQAVEARFGRERQVPDGPRTLDLDLLLFGERRIRGPRLTVPHPRMDQRTFVLGPLASLEPGLRIPSQSGSVAELLAGLGSSAALASH